MKKNFESLMSLINRLDNAEIKRVNKFLSYYYSENSNSKSQQYIRLVKYEKEKSIINIQNILYGKINIYAFNKLTSRLKDKILEVLLFNSNSFKKHYSERVQVLFDLKKKLIHCDIMSLRGLRDDGDILCKKIITKGTKYEMYDVVMNALLIRQRFINIRKHHNEILNIQNEIIQAENKYKSIIDCQNIYNSIINKINNNTNSESYISELINAIDYIKIQYEKYKSYIIKYYLNYLKTEKYQIENNYTKAEECLIEIESILSNKSIYSENRKGTTLLNIANNKLYLEKYDEAISFAIESKKYFPNNIFNQALVSEYMFYAYFYKQDYVNSEQIINKLVALPEANNVLFSIHKWKYFDSVMKFVRGEYIDCIKGLNNISELDKDKEGWNFNKRLLIIMCRIELQEFESVDLQVSNLEKFIKRSLSKRDIRLRYIYILRLLLKLFNSNYNFSAVYNQRKKYFDLLESTDEKLKWKIKSPELIIFDIWFKVKVNAFT